MALTKSVKIDKIEIVTDYKHLQIRTATTIREDENVLSTNFSRKILQCGYLDDTGTFCDTNLSNEDSEIVNIANAVWSDEVKNIWREKLLYEESVNDSVDDVGIAT